MNNAGEIRELCIYTWRISFEHDVFLNMGYKLPYSSRVIYTKNISKFWTKVFIAQGSKKFLWKNKVSLAE